MNLLFIASIGLGSSFLYARRDEIWKSWKRQLKTVHSKENPNQLMNTIPKQHGPECMQRCVVIMIKLYIQLSSESVDRFSTKIWKPLLPLTVYLLITYTEQTYTEALEKILYNIFRIFGINFNQNRFRGFYFEKILFVQETTSWNKVNKFQNFNCNHSLYTYESLI